MPAEASGGGYSGPLAYRYGTELDLGPPGAYAWLAANSRRFGFIKRYEWEPWH
jgi:LAS superfamily LD-carboxypeptidase LdcB